MTWDDTMSVGVAALDEDHKKLVALLNQLFEAVTTGHGRESLGKILDGLIDYTKVHFAHDERLFAATGYQDFAAHKKEHDDLTRQVLDIQHKYKAGATGLLTLEVMHFLRGWLADHIQGKDRKYGPYLNSKGIH